MEKVWSGERSKCKGLLYGRGKATCLNLVYVVCTPQADQLLGRELAMLAVSQHPIFSGAVLLNSRAPVLCTGLTTGPSLSYALLEDNLLEIRQHLEASHV